VQHGRRRLVREPEDRNIAGVCAGLADALGVDAWMIRVAAVILAFATPAVIVAYLVLAVVLPERQPGEPRVRAQRWCSGVPMHPVLLIAGVVVVASLIDGAWWLKPFPAAIALVGIGVWLLLRDRDEPALASSPPPTPMPQGSSQPTMFGTSTSTGPMGPDGPVDAPPAYDSNSVNGTDLTHPLAGSPWLGEDGDGTSSGGGDPAATSDAGAAGAAAPPRPSYGAWWEASPDPLPEHEAAPATVVAPAPRARSSRLGRAVLAVLLLGGGVLWLGDSLDILSVSATTAMALALVVVGLGLLAATFWGRAHGLIPVGLVLVGVLVIVEVADFPTTLGGGVGDRTDVIVTQADMADEHQLGLGDLTLDLTGAPLTAGSTPTVEAQVGAGELTIVVPEDATVELDARSGAGDLEAPDDAVPTDDGVGFNDHVTLDGREGGGRVEIDAQVGLGDIVLVREDVASSRERDEGDRTPPTTAEQPAAPAAEEPEAPPAAEEAP
jgi:phage shock protein PspC (stress-responsive transcriptional regulator)